MIVLFKDIILDEYQVYMHRIYGADVIIFPVDPITSKMVEKFAFICDSMGMLPVPLIENESGIEKIKNWNLIRMVATEGEIDIRQDVFIAKYKEGSGLEVCLIK
jgi:indole-3-glycerol phosphate synthase